MDKNTEEVVLRFILGLLISSEANLTHMTTIKWEDLSEDKKQAFRMTDELYLHSIDYILDLITVSTKENNG